MNPYVRYNVEYRSRYWPRAGTGIRRADDLANGTSACAGRMLGFWRPGHGGNVFLRQLLFTVHIQNCKMEW